MKAWLPPKEGAEIRLLEGVDPFYGFEVPVSAGPLRHGPGKAWCPFCELEKRRRRPRLLGLASFVGLGIGSVR